MVQLYPVYVNEATSKLRIIQEEITMKKHSFNLLLHLLAGLMIIGTTNAQWPPAPTPNDTLVSCRILPDRRIRFSIYAPEAHKVTLGGSDIPETGAGVNMIKESTRT